MEVAVAADGTVVMSRRSAAVGAPRSRLAVGLTADCPQAPAANSHSTERTAPSRDGCRKIKPPVGPTPIVTAHTSAATSPTRLGVQAAPGEPRSDVPDVNVTVHRHGAGLTQAMIAVRCWGDSTPDDRLEGPPRPPPPCPTHPLARLAGSPRKRRRATSRSAPAGCGSGGSAGSAPRSPASGSGAAGHPGSRFATGARAWSCGPASTVRGGIGSNEVCHSGAVDRVERGAAARPTMLSRGLVFLAQGSRLWRWRAARPWRVRKGRRWLAIVREYLHAATPAPRSPARPG